MKKTPLRGEPWNLKSRGRAAMQVVVLVCLLLIVTERSAMAYGDPGSGALILQILFAGVVGALFYVRRFAAWVKRKVSKN